MPSTLTRVAQVYKSGSTDLAFPPAGWVGSKLGTKGDIVTMTTAGIVDQSAAVTNLLAAPGAGARIACLNDSIPASGSTGTLPSAAGTIVGIEKFDDDTLIELPLAASAVGAGTVGVPAAIAATPALVLAAAIAAINSQFRLARATNGTYYVDFSTTSTPHVEIVGLGTRYPASANFATVLCRVLSNARIN